MKIHSFFRQKAKRRFFLRNRYENLLMTEIQEILHGGFPPWMNSSKKFLQGGTPLGGAPPGGAPPGGAPPGGIPPGRNSSREEFLQGGNPPWRISWISVISMFS